MKFIYTIFCVLISLAGYGQQLLEGTWSYRTGNDGAVTSQIGVSDYYDMTSWDSSPYQQFRFHSGNGAPDAVNFKMNFRLLPPNGYDENRSEKYPIIILLHGLGESGIRGGDRKFPPYTKDESKYLNNDYVLFNGGRAHLAAVNKTPSDARAFPGFVFFPQNERSWNTEFIDNIVVVLEELIKKYNIDPNRVYLNGLSDGGKGVWTLAAKRPDLFAAVLPISWVQPDVDINKLLYLPIWHFQGELDQYPTVNMARNFQQKLREAGANTRYTEYANAGHGIWDRAYAEPDYFKWMLGKNKTDIHVLFGKSLVCPDDAVNIKLGISKGFKAYQWRKVINGKSTTFAPGTTNNEFVATELGDYFVRFSRVSNPNESDWTEWSRPKTVGEATRPVAPDIQADGSTILPSPDGKTSVDLSVPATYESYNWYKNGILLQEDNFKGPVITVSDQGSYTVKVREVGGCMTGLSKAVTVTVTNANPSLATPTNLTGTGYSETQIDLSWEDNANNETGYEIYRSTSSGSDYNFVAKIVADRTTFRDGGLLPETRYYYIVIAVNDNEASNPSKEASATTLSDITPPTSPNLTYELLSTTSARLNWIRAVDRIGVANYDIFIGNELVTTTADTAFVLNNLVPNTLYNITVKARDFAGNLSPASNQVTIVTTFNGLTYKYYFGDFWSKVADYQSWEVSKSGYIANFNIKTEEQGGVRPDEQINYFAYDFEGYLYIEKAGQYQFSTRSAAGSILRIDDIVVVNNDGLHAAATKTSSNRYMSVGAHRIKVQFFDNIEEEVLEVAYSGADTQDKFVPIPDEVLKSGDFVYPSIPSAPANLVADNWSFTQINLTWQDRSSDETGFEIYRSSGEEESYKIIKTTAPDMTSYEDTDLSPNTRYDYKVKAISNNGSSDYSEEESGTWLSVVLKYFDSKNDGDNAVLTWATEREVDNANFVVERSPDGINFEPLDTLDGEGNSNALVNYDYLDTSPLRGNNYYRLKQSDIYGNSGFSNIDSLFSGFGKDGKGIDALLYPVPTKKGSQLTIEATLANTNGEVLVQIMDGTGRVYYKDFADPKVFKNPYFIDVQHWATGIYIVNISQGTENCSKRFVID